MALDVYVGPLTLYYAGQWENAAQKYARERGLPYRMIGRPDATDAEKDPQRIREGVIAWRTLMTLELGTRLSEPLEWDEKSKDYATSRPDWDAFVALILWAAYVECDDLRRPSRVGDTGVQSDPAVKRLRAAGNRGKFVHIVHDIEFWFPNPLGFVFDTESPSGGRVRCGSTIALFAQLQALNEATWKADLPTIEAWVKTTPGKDDPLEDLAKFGFATMHVLSKIANARRMPIKMDY